MSYLNQAHDPRRRATAIAGATIIHAGLGLALVIGLAATGVVDPKDGWDPFVLTPEPLPKPTPPEPRQQQTQQSFVTAPTPPLKPLVTNDNDLVVVDDVIDDRLVVVDPGPRIEPVVEPARPAFVPRGARPSNNPLRWITTDDYPGRDLRDGNEGITAYRLIVGTNGRVSACEITRTTGSTGLDDATCRFLANRARFEAATDDTGAKVVGRYTGTVKWEIPD